MTDGKKTACPIRRVYLDPHCADCFHSIRGEMTFCDDPAQEDCPECGRGPIPYNIDRRSLRKGER